MSGWPLPKNPIRWKWLAAWVVLAPAAALAADTAGMMLAAEGFYHTNLVSAEWRATVPEYESNQLLRIEFNGINFQGTNGNMSVGAMVMNLCHDYPVDALHVTNYFPGVSLYFSSLYSNLNEGAEALADPANPPCFKRIFEDVDGMGTVGVNFYNTQPLRDPEPANPLRLVWRVWRGQRVVDPAGNFNKDMSGNWVPLAGNYWEWFFQAEIDGQPRDIARYLLPESHALEINNLYPLTLHQEFFGAATNGLGNVKTDVRFHDFQLMDGAGNTWPIRRWRSVWRINDDWFTKDQRHGWCMTNGWLASRSGHDADVVLCTRDLDVYFSMTAGRISSYVSMSVAADFNSWSAGANNMCLVADHVWRWDAAFTNLSFAEFKFAANGTWDANWGDADQPQRVPPLAGTGNWYGANIQVTNTLNGVYRFTFDERTADYSLEAVAEADTDGDGMPNEWESAHGLDPMASWDARRDDDGDGMDNVSEFIAGTFPDSKQSVFKAHLEPGAGAATLDWPGTTNRTYAVFHATNLVDSDWSVLGANSNLVCASNAAMGVAVATPPASACYYRIQVRK